MWTGRLSWRRLRVLLENLPAESAYCTAMRNTVGDEALREQADTQTGFGPWSQTDLLLASIVDNTAHLIWMQTDGKTPPPNSWPRPGVERPKNVRALNAHAEAYLREVERLHGAQPAPDWTPDIAEEP